MLDQRSQPNPGDRSKDRSLAETSRSGVSSLWIGLACLACIGLLGAEPRIIPYGRLNLDPVFVRLASASLAILAGAFLATALAAEMRLKAAGKLLREWQERRRRA